MSSAEVAAVLIVDDDYDLRDTLQDVISDAGYKTATARDGLEALAYLRANPKPCLILLDMMMPRCDGASFRAAQLEDPAIADVPVVLLTADNHAGAKAGSMRLSGYIRKPVELSTLHEVLALHCRSARGTEGK